MVLAGEVKEELKNVRYVKNAFIWRARPAHIDMRVFQP